MHSRLASDTDSLMLMSTVQLASSHFCKYKKNDSLSANDGRFAIAILTIAAVKSPWQAMILQFEGHCLHCTTDR